MKQKLISSKDYGKTLKEVSDLEYRQKRESYDLLLDQPPKLGDFIPCDKEGKPLDEPKDYKEACDFLDKMKGSGRSYQIENPKEFFQYQEALERVKFEGFTKSKGYKDLIQYKDNGSYSFLNIKDVETLEDLTHLNLTLKHKI